jgi:hypothetical protein
MGTMTKNEESEGSTIDPKTRKLIHANYTKEVEEGLFEIYERIAQLRAKVSV